MAAAHDVIEAAHTDGEQTAARTARILLYSDDRSTRSEVRAMVGRRASADTPLIEWVDAATPDAVVEYVESGAYDLIVLDGEAPKHGGMGLCRTLKSEIYQCPPVLLLIARQQDTWLAAWSEADAVVSAPFDPVELQETVAGQLREQ